MTDPVRDPDAFTVLVCPTHVGTNLRGLWRSKLARTVRRYGVDVGLLTEIQSPVARGRLAIAFPTARWVRGGTRPPSISRGSAGTIALARRNRFARRPTSSNRLVSRYRDRMHPQRRATVLDLVDKLAGVQLRLVPLHPWALGPNPPADIRAGHLTQVERYQTLCQDAPGEAIAGGDTNETGDGDGTTPVERAMAAAHMRNGRPLGDGATRIVEAFVSSGLRVLSWRILDPDEVGTDHVAILLEVTYR